MPMQQSHRKATSAQYIDMAGWPRHDHAGPGTPMHAPTHSAMPPATPCAGLDGSAFADGAAAEAVAGSAAGPVQGPLPHRAAGIRY